MKISENDIAAMEDPYTYVPPHTRTGLIGYIENGWIPGDFLGAVLSNDLKGAVDRADDENIVHLPGIVRWLYNFAPAPCWGSSEKVTDWISAIKGAA